MFTFNAVAAASSAAAHSALKTAAYAAETTGATGAISTNSSSGSSGASNGGAPLPKALDKDAFLKLLVTQLEYQDPSQPMDDKEFISQMAQFSSLEQMTNVSDGLNVLTQMQITTQALTLVGRNVTLKNPDGGDPLSGKVDEVKFVSGEPRLVVGGKEYGLSDVLSVK